MTNVGMEVKEKEPSISTMVLNFDNKFDPFAALSTPLYQTATFKQVCCFLQISNDLYFDDVVWMCSNYTKVQKFE